MNHTVATQKWCTVYLEQDDCLTPTKNIGRIDFYQDETVTNQLHSYLYAIITGLIPSCELKIDKPLSHYQWCEILCPILLSWIEQSLKHAEEEIYWINLVLEKHDGTKHQSICYHNRADIEKLYNALHMITFY